MTIKKLNYKLTLDKQNLELIDIGRKEREAEIIKKIWDFPIEYIMEAETEEEAVEILNDIIKQIKEQKEQ